MCNFCREVTAYHIYARTGLLGDPDAALEAWKSSHRRAFYAAHGFVVPELVPQSNDIRRPADGATVYEACVP